MNAHELIVDSFAGGGGASLGIEWALGRSPDIAINHDAEAIAMHRANHPHSRHYQEDVWKVDPVEACGGRPVGLMWLSPDCKHFSKAKGGKPVSKKIRGLAWVAVRWAAAVKPRVICLENVEEFQTWGPVLPNGQPCPARRGVTFRRFVAKLRRLGYEVQWRELRASNHGVPTIRKRLFLVARCDGLPIVWPKPTHGKGLLPFCTAAECIDWSISCPSIFLTREEAKAIGVKRPLAEATMRRIARGLKRFVLDNPRPFIVSLTHQGGDDRVRSVDTPLSTITGAHRGEQALVVPTLIQTGYGEREGQAPRVPGLGKPLGTVVAGGGKHALVAAYLAQHNAGWYEGAGRQVELPLSTITHRGTQQQIVASHLVKLKGTSKDGQSIDEPLHTVQASGLHYGEVRAFLVAYYGNEKDGGTLFDPLRTVTAKERFGLVTVHGELYAIADIGMRMLLPRELFRAQGFPDSYVIDVPYKKPGAKRAKRLGKTAQVKMCGNSVPPGLAAAVVRAQFGMDVEEAAA